MTVQSVPSRKAGDTPRRPFWHGGGRVDGDLLLPGDETGKSRSGDTGVFVTTERSLAETYAATVDGRSWVYEVEPLGDLEPIRSLVGGPTISYRCERALILRRFTLSNTRRAQLQRAVRMAGSLLEEVGP